LFVIIAKLYEFEMQYMSWKTISYQYNDAQIYNMEQET
jgi:hypothetical protein